MELRQLQYFTAVAETLNFSRAAEILYISQPALSQQIADLERELGVLLLQRSKRAVSLTPAGALLLQEAKKLLYQSEKLAPLIRSQEQAHSSDQELVLGVDKCVDLSNSPLYRILLTESVYALRQQIPSLRPIFRVCEPPDLMNALDMGTIDLGFFRSECPVLKNRGHIRLESRALYRDEMVLLLRSGHPLEDSPEVVRAVLKQRGLYLLKQEMIGMSQILRILGDLDTQPQIRFCENQDVMLLTAESGEGAAVIPLAIVQGMRNPELQCLHFRTPAAACYFLAAWREDNPNTLISEIVEMLAEKFAEI